MRYNKQGCVLTERPERVSAPEVVALDRAEVAVPQEEGRALLGVLGYVGGVARVPPGVPREGAYGRVRRGLEHVQERPGVAPEQRLRESRQDVVQQVACLVTDQRNFAF